MKKLLCITVSIVLLFALAACTSAPGPNVVEQDVPQYGLWFCDSLNMEIDFSHGNSINYNCVKQYHDDKSEYDEYALLMPFSGNDVSIAKTSDLSDVYLRGYYKYSDDTFSITTDDGMVYTFKMIDEDT